MTDKPNNPYQPLSVDDLPANSGTVSFSKQIGIICVAVTCGVAMFVGILAVTALFTSLSGSDYWWVGGFIVSIPAALVCAERVNRALLSWVGSRSLKNSMEPAEYDSSSMFDGDES